MFTPTDYFRFANLCDDQGYAMDAAVQGAGAELHTVAMMLRQAAKMQQMLDDEYEAKYKRKQRK